MAPAINKRQAITQDPSNSNNGWWWYSGTAVAIKWSIIGAILVLFLVFFLGAYYHAQRRMKKGLPPLAYHRWLLPRQQRARFEPHLAEQNYYQPQQRYQLNQYHPPPPAYNPDEAPLPKYAPPEGPTKMDPNQTVHEVPADSGSSQSNSEPRPHVEPTAPVPSYSVGNHVVR